MRPALLLGGPADGDVLFVEPLSQRLRVAAGVPLTARVESIDRQVLRSSAAGHEYERVEFGARGLRINSKYEIYLYAG